jgi:hypothetical protein
MDKITQKPTIGRIVHYWLRNPEECEQTPNPAIVTRVYFDGHVDLQVFGSVPEDPPHLRADLRFNVSHGGDALRSGTWTWPPRFA